MRIRVEVAQARWTSRQPPHEDFANQAEAHGDQRIAVVELRPRL